MAGDGEGDLIHEGWSRWHHIYDPARGVLFFSVKDWRKSDAP